MSNSKLSEGKVILVVGGSMDYGKPYAKLAKRLGLSFTGNAGVLARTPERVALAVFTGGEDVDPSMYKTTPHRSTYSFLSRDVFEKGIFDEAFGQGIPLAGICRGAQFLCVMAGGTLVQDITGHAGRMHPLTIKKADGSTYSVTVNSSHHQMQNPFNLVNGEDYELLGWMDEPVSKHYAFNANTVVPSAGLSYAGVRMEPDVVFYPKIKALAAQYHPEWLDTDDEGFKAYEELVDQYILPMMSYDENRTRAA